MLSFLAAILVALTTQARPGSVEGLVVRVETSEPIAKAVVEISGGNGTRFAASTGSDGRFEFKNLVPGSYKLTVSKSGYLDGGYGKRGPNGQPLTLKVETSQSIKDLRMTMVPTGAISGRVYDISGEPLANVSVQALKYTYSEERGRVLTAIKSVLTDDRGEYRLFWLPPGKYYISATPPGTRSAGLVYMTTTGGGHLQGFVLDSRGVPTEDRGGAIEKLGEAYVPIYYPGVPDEQDAQLIDLGPGAEVREDFGLSRATARKVRGVVIDAATGQPTNSASVVLISPGGLRGQFPLIPSSDGTFEISDVLPGSYFLSATSRVVDRTTRETSRVSGAQIPVVVGDADVDRLSVVLAPGADISGQLIVDGGPLKLDNYDGNPRPVLTLKNDLQGLPLVNSNQPSEFISDTQFIFDRVLEGDYHVEVVYVPPSTYIKSVRFGGADAFNGSIHIEPGRNGTFEVVLATGSGSLDGNVVNVRGEKAGNVTVALIPSSFQRQDLYKNATTDETGHFHMQGVPPGDYSVFAWEDIENGLWRDPAFIRGSQNSGKPVQIGNGAPTTVEVTAIPFAY
jgi:hypothetical protein